MLVRMSSEDNKPTLSKREAAALLSKIEVKITAMLHRAEALAWQIGHEVDRIATEGLHLAEGYASLDAYLDARFPQGKTQLRVYRRVALAFEEASAKKHGVSKLDAGLTYLDAIGKSAEPRSLLSLIIKVPTDGKRVEGIPFAKATYTDLQRAIAAARLRPEKHDAAAVRAAKRAEALLQLAVAAPAGTYRHAPRVRVRPNPNGKGGLRIDVMGIDGDDVKRIGEALSEAQLAPDDVAVPKRSDAERRKTRPGAH